MAVTSALLHELTASLQPLVFDALDAGIALRDDVCSGRGIEEPWLRAHLVRYQARALLEQTARDVGWEVDTTVPNSGIHLRSTSGHRIKLLSHPLGAVPHPGRNVRRQAYWSGQLDPVQLALFDSSASPGVRPLNLLLLWEASNDGTLATAVAHTTASWPYEGTVHCDAYAWLKHPIDTGGGFAVDDDPGEDLAVWAVDADAEARLAQQEKLSS